MRVSYLGYQVSAVHRSDSQYHVTRGECKSTDKYLVPPDHVGLARASVVGVDL